jgi:tRNA threonylcarbamoyladenosine biosynthesis protein TsaB
MYTLAFDTCFDACSAAIGGTADGSSTAQALLLAHRFELMQTGHAERLVPMIAELLGETGLAMADIGRIAVTIGPGTFTGTRIGVAAARAFALAGKIPVVGLSSLALIARQAALHGPQDCDVCIIVDVRHDEVYAQVFDETGLTPRTPPTLLRLEQARTLAISSKALLAGSGAALVGGAHARSALEFRADARYGIDLVSRNHRTNHAIAPLYLRPPDAKPSAANTLQKARDIAAEPGLR